MAPILESVADELKEKIKIVKVNIEDPANQELAMTYQVDRIPNMKLFKNGKFIKEIVGLNEKEGLLAELQSFL
jgi:thioredoxin-like negative regulator of GroEL